MKPSAALTRWGFARLVTIAATLASVVALAFVVQVAAASSPGDESLNLTITVSDSEIPPDPGCIESDPTWFPLWTDSGAATEVADYDLFYGGSMTESIDLGWQDGETDSGGICVAVPQTGTVTTSLLVTKTGTPQAGWSLSNGCVTEVCNADEVATINTEITPPGDILDGDQYEAAVTLTWAP